VTKRREPLTYQHTLTKIAGLIGWDRAGAVCGVTDRQVRNWSDPDCETEIRLIDAERLDRAFIEMGGDHAPFHRLFALRLEIAARRDAACMVALAGDIAKESGEAVAAVLQSADGTDPDAVRRARKEVQEAIDKLTDCAAKLEGREP
jgi:hypothetical protein